MTVVSVSRYRVVTLDSSSHDYEVTARLETAEALVSEWLRRPLSRSQRTERVQVYPDGRAYPLATPLVSAAPEGTTVEDSATFLAVTPDAVPGWFGDGLDDHDPYRRPLATIDYLGGWVGRDEAGSDSDKLPATIERYIALTACALAGSPDSGIPAGATSVTLGDASITFAGAADDLDVLVPGATRALKPWRKKSPT